MNIYDEVILTISLISLAIGLFGVAIYFGYKIKKLEDTVDNLYSYFIAALEPQIKRIREVVNNEIINKKEDASINNTDWMYSIFDKDKIKEHKERRTKEASDILIVSFDSSLDDEAGLCVSREVNGKVYVLKMELGEQADILYRLLTDQTTKAEIKTESEVEE